ALVDPNLDTDDPVRGVGFGRAVVDVGTQGVQGHTAFAIPFGTGDFDPVQTAGAHDLDALGAKTHCVLHRTLHGATEHDALFQLLGDRVSDELSIGLRLADFFDVDVHGHAHQALEVCLQVLDVLAALADHHARACRVNGDACVLGRTLDDHTANRSVLQLLLEVFANANVLAALADHHARACRVNGDACVLGRTLDDHTANRSVLQLLLEVFANANVLAQHATESLVVRIPARTPVTVDREAEANWMNFLSH